jgi:hypothetical protein
MADVTKRRKVRAAEAKRDSLQEKIQKAKQDLVQVRALLKQHRGTK